MADLTPPVLNFTRELQWRIATGQSMREAMRACLDQDSSKFGEKLRDWWHRQQKSEPSGSSFDFFKTQYQQALADIILRGRAGQPTQETLLMLCSEIERATEDALESHLGTLPFKLLVPLLLLQFPALLILLLGPMLRELQTQMGG